MPLNPTQQTAADELTAAFCKFMTAVGGPATRTAADVPAPGPGFGGGVAAPAYWFDPPEANLLAFCTKHKLDRRQIQPWVQTPKGDTVEATDGTSLVSFPVLPALDPNDVANLKEYAGCGGYGPDGVARLQTAVGFGRARGKAYQVELAVNPEEVLVGAGSADKPTVEYGLMAGNVDMNDFQNLHFGGGTTIPAVAATMYKQSSRKPGDPGASGL